MDMIIFFQNMTSILWGSYGFQALFYLGLILIFLMEKERFQRNYAFWYPVCVLLVIYNPVTHLLCKYIFGEGALTAYYCRLFCLIPIVFVIAYAFVLVLQHTFGWKKLCSLLLMLFILTCVGHSAYSEEWFVKAHNFNKVPMDVIQISALFSEENQRISIMVPTDLSVYMRQIDSRFCMPYGRYQTDISDQLMSNTPDVQLVLSYALKTETDYIVVLCNEEVLTKYINCGCEVVGYTNRYTVLRQ